MVRFPYISRMQYGIIDQTHVNAAFELANELQLMMPALRTLVSKSQFPGFNIFPARIDGSPEVLAESESSGGDDVAVRWRYQWTEVIGDPGSDDVPIGWKERGDDGRKSDSPSGDGDDHDRWAVNMIEAGNNSTHSLVGPGVDIKGSTYPDGFKPQPISEGSVVQMFVTTIVKPEESGVGDGETHTAIPYFYFWCANAHDGEC